MKKYYYVVVTKEGEWKDEKLYQTMHEAHEAYRTAPTGALIEQVVSATGVAKIIRQRGTNNEIKPKKHKIVK